MARMELNETNLLLINMDVNILNIYSSDKFDLTFCYKYNRYQRSRQILLYIYDRYQIGRCVRVAYSGRGRPCS